MKEKYQNISRWVIYSPFILMASIIIFVSVSNVVYNYYEYHRNIDFETTQLNQFLTKNVAPELVQDAINEQYKHIINNRFN